MTEARKTPSDIAFTASVKAIQSRRGSRSGYARLESGAGWATAITSDLADFIASQTALGRVGQPEDIGGVIAALLSPDSRWITAQRIEASGGMFL